MDAHFRRHWGPFIHSVVIWPSPQITFAGATHTFPVTIDLLGCKGEINLSSEACGMRR